MAWLGVNLPLQCILFIFHGKRSFTSIGNFSMVLRKRLLACLSTGLLPLFSVSLVFISQAHALIIQPVVVKSALGEPFYAEIGLSDLDGIALDDLAIGMANAQELADLNVRGGSYNGNLSFNVQSQGGNRGVIIIRGRQPVNEPFVDFVLKVKNGQNTRLQRVNAMIDPVDKNRKMVSLQAPVQVSPAQAINLASSSTAVLDPVAVSSEKTAPGHERRLSVMNMPPPDMPARPSASQLASKAPEAKPQDTKTAKNKARDIEVSTQARANK
ncbi:MAG: hypothetical protein EOP49_41605, partial [Sphingobacteriales bacterium]